GREIPGSRGNKYFNHAWELPGVKELFDELKPSKKAPKWRNEERKLRAEVRRNMDGKYYGFDRNED
ncbi:hypothetical protein B9Z19DRAFT_930885, partial [Tuber borchii]